MDYVITVFVFLRLLDMQKSVMKRWEKDLREFAATKKQLCDLAERMGCPLSTR